MEGKQGFIPEFGHRLKMARIARKMKAVDVVKILGINKSTLSNWENDVNMPSHAMVMKLATLYGVRVDYFYGLEEKSDTIYIDDLDKDQVSALMVVADQFRKDNEKE